uniref:Uncharacterized protein n=1 Tax=Anguilla anguilla TaxID=7936 RepID=A0A0E9QEG0_ANGAN
MMKICNPATKIPTMEKDADIHSLAWRQHGHEKGLAWLAEFSTELF